MRTTVYKHIVRNIAFALLALSVAGCNELSILTELSASGVEGRIERGEFSQGDTVLRPAIGEHFCLLQPGDRLRRYTGTERDADRSGMFFLVLKMTADGEDLTRIHKGWIQTYDGNSMCVSHGEEIFVRSMIGRAIIVEKDELL